MVLSIAIVLVLVLLAIALLPPRKQSSGLKQASVPAGLLLAEPVRAASLREQQVQEEAAAIAAEYHRRADEVWLDELRGKAAGLLGPAEKATKL